MSLIKEEGILFALSANKDLASRVAKKLGMQLGDVHLETFPSGEIMACPSFTIRGKRVFIIESTCPPVNTHIMETLIFIDALKRASAREINVIIPYFGYARQDRKSKPREPISSKLVADLFVTAGANRIVTFDLHAVQTQGFFSCLEDDLSAVSLLAYTVKHDKSVNPHNLVVVSPDHGGVVRARRFAEVLNNTSIAIIDKRRNAERQAEVMNIIGDVKGKDCLIVDDMLDTAGTAIAAKDALIKAGGQKIMMAVTHPVLSNPAYERLSASPFYKLWVTDSIPLDDRFVNNKDLNIVICSLCDTIARAINAIFDNTSISAAAEFYKKLK